jgi:hypothetical protein
MTDKARRLAGFEREGARVVTRVVGWLRNTFIPEVLVGMVDARGLDQTTLQRLAERIEEARKEREQGDKKGRTERKE